MISVVIRKHHWTSTTPFKSANSHPRKLQFLPFPWEFSCLEITQIPDVLGNLGQWDQRVFEGKIQRKLTVFAWLWLWSTSTYRLSPKSPHGTKCQGLLRVTGRRWQLRRQRRESSRKALGPLNIQHSAQISFLHPSPAPLGFFPPPPYFAVNSQEPTLTYSD